MRLPEKRVTRDPINLILGRLHGERIVVVASTPIPSFFPLPFVCFLLSPTVIHPPSLAFLFLACETSGEKRMAGTQYATDWPPRLSVARDCLLAHVKELVSSRETEETERKYGGWKAGEGVVGRKEWRSFSYVLSVGTLLEPGSSRVSSGINAR